MSGRHRRTGAAARSSTSAGLAGWVFADGLLALTLIGLASGAVVDLASGPPPAAAVAAVAQPTAEPTPTATPSPAPPAPPAPPPPAPVVADGVAQAPVVLEVAVAGVDDEAVRLRVAEAVAPLVAEGRRAAFVLTFGTAREPGAGTALARRANGLLDAAAPEVFAGSAKRDFWRADGEGAPQAGVVRLEVYLLQQV
ncbi:hypothetical protein [Kineococcus terrestris]|uniref:hypothetical protein n=1 Tax=Kineococcus terrestris TaxID=2044856 RepID=UPI0034DB2A4D